MSKVANALWEIRKYHLKYNFYPLPDFQEYFTDKAPAWDNSDIAFEIAKLRTDNAYIEFEKTPPRPSTINNGVEIDFFKKSFLTDRELELLLVGSQIVNYSPGKIVVARSEQVPHLYCIKSGEIAVDILNAAGKTIRIGTLGPKNFCGIDVLLRDTAPKLWKSSVWYTTLTQVVLHKIDLEHVYQVCSVEEKLFYSLNYALAGALAMQYRSQIQQSLSSSSKSRFKSSPTPSTVSNKIYIAKKYL